jgi:hypothetical protein
MDLSHSHCNFKLHANSWHSVIPFLPFVLSHLGLPPPEHDPIPITSRLLHFTTPTTASFGIRLSYKPSPLTPRKTPSAAFKDACSRVRYLAMDVLLLFALVVGMCLPTRCLTMVILVRIYCDHEIMCIQASESVLSVDV